MTYCNHWCVDMFQLAVCPVSWGPSCCHGWPQ